MSGADAVQEEIVGRLARGSLLSRLIGSRKVPLRLTAVPRDHVVGSRVRGCGVVSAGRTRSAGAVEKAIAKSPLPLLYEDPVRARPNTARAASRLRSRASSGASVATTIMQEPSPGSLPTDAAATPARAKD